MSGFKWPEHESTLERIAWWNLAACFVVAARIRTGKAAEGSWLRAAIVMLRGLLR